MKENKTIVVKAVSTFHNYCVSQAFRVPAKTGEYPRRCPNACDYKKDKKTGVAIHCGCGYPVARTEWEAPKGWKVFAEWYHPFDYPAPKENILICLEESVED